MANKNSKVQPEKGEPKQKTEQVAEATPEGQKPETTEAPEPETSGEHKVQPEKGEPLGVGSVSVEVISSSYSKPPVDTSLVKIKVGYPNDYQDKKHLVDGKEYEVHESTAEILINKGIAAKV
jgi:hypothetical protein